MSHRTFQRPLTLALSLLLAVSMSSKSFGAAAAPGKPKTPEQFAQIYMAAFNKGDKATLNTLRLPATAPSEMQKMIDEICEAEMKEHTQYTKFEILPIPPDMSDAPHMGMDGRYYKPTIKPTKMVKLTSVTKNGSSSTTMPIGLKNGVYYLATLEPAPNAEPPYKFGWDRFTMPTTTWSVLLPNEPEPGRAALEAQGGPNALNDPDIYGVVKNTAAIKTTQHWFWCGESGKRVNAADNKEKYRAACTTYDPDTLKEWFSDAKKNLDDTVDLGVRSAEGKLISKKDIELNGAPGREFEIQGKDGTKIVGRVYWVKDALYELTVESTKPTPDTESATKFLSSLQVQ